VRVYLDHAATTPVDERVVAEMKPFFSVKYGNASSIHAWGREAREAVEHARSQVAALIGALPEEIIFTGGGTEADNLAILGGFDFGRGRRVACSAIEHPAVLEPCAELARRGFERVLLPVDRDGILLVDESRKLVKGAALVSVMHANNEVGTIQPVEEACEAAHDAGALFHCDAVQSAGKESLNVEKIGVDLLSLSSHKIYGPKGVGALFVRRGVKLKPLVFGGGQERGLRSGTENVAAIVGFGKACELARREGRREAKRLRDLRERLLGRILRIEGTELNGHRSQRLPNNANVSFSAIEGEAILLGLDERGIAVSTGSACSSKKLQPSHVLLAMGRKPEEAHGSIRFTLGRSNDARQIDFVAECVAEVVEALRMLSPFVPGEDLSKYHFSDEHEGGFVE
jgi:cysteine desulfurase